MRPASQREDYGNKVSGPCWLLTPTQTHPRLGGTAHLGPASLRPAARCKILISWAGFSCCRCSNDLIPPQHFFTACRDSVMRAEELGGHEPAAESASERKITQSTERIPGGHTACAGLHRPWLRPNQRHLRAPWRPGGCGSGHSPTAPQLSL